MRHLRRTTLATLTAAAVWLLLAIGPAVGAGAAAPYPDAKGFANDSAGVLVPAELAELEDLSRRLEAATTAELAVAVIPTLDGTPIRQYATELFARWQVGKTGKDNGVLVVLAMKEREIFVEVGYGLEGALPDGKVGRLLDSHALPAFREGKYGAGLVRLARELAAVIEKEAGAGGTAPPRRGLGLVWRWGAGLLAAVFLVMAAGVVALIAATRPRCPRCRARLRTTDRVIEPATKLAAGRGIRTYLCPRCGHSFERPFTIPYLPPADFGGGGRRGGGWRGGGGGWPRGGGFGGFGGGRSGGGGAGRRW